MTQYSSEAAAEAARVEHADRRRKLIQKITKGFFILVFLAAAGSAYAYRDNVVEKLSHLKMKSLGEMQSDRKAKAESKAVEAQKAGEQRVQEIEATLK